MTDEDMERIRNTQNILGRAENVCTGAINYVKKAWNEEEYDLFTSPKATEAVFEFIETLSLIREKSNKVYEALEECYRK